MSRIDFTSELACIVLLSGRFQHEPTVTLLSAFGIVAVASALVARNPGVYCLAGAFVVGTVARRYRHCRPSLFQPAPPPEYTMPPVVSAAAGMQKR